MLPEHEKSVVLAGRMLDLCADTDGAIGLHALVMATASTASTLGVSFEAVRCAMHVFMNPQGLENATALANVISLDQRRGQG